MNQEQLQRRAEQAKHLSAIRDLPSYLVLKEIVERRIEQQFRVFVSPDPPPNLDHARGFIAGMRYVLDMVEGGEKQFEKAVQQARKLEGDEP